MRAAIIPTGKNKSISGGGGSGGSINGRTTMNAARHASTTTDPKLIQYCPIIYNTDDELVVRAPTISLANDNATSANDDDGKKKVTLESPSKWLRRRFVV